MRISSDYICRHYNKRAIKRGVNTPHQPTFEVNGYLGGKGGDQGDPSFPGLIISRSLDEVIAGAVVLVVTNRASYQCTLGPAQVRYKPDSNAGDDGLL
jgi:hypothetical protein